ncbi:MAG: efflux RND transporter periplasmic adaptor subunit [Bacteroidota bacterium]
MKTITIFFISLSVMLTLVSCGGNNIEAQKIKLEKLKAQQAEIASQIKTIEEELKSGGVDLNANEKVKIVLVTPVKESSFEHSIDVQGRVDADENVSYTAKVPSVVNRINVKTGEHVSEGQVLAELDAKPIKAQLDALRKSYELANTMYEKQKSLWDQNIGSEMQYLQAKNTKEGLEKQMQTIKENLDLYFIKSDFSGTVDEVAIKVGQSVSPGIPAIRVVNLDKLKVKADISESYASKVKINDDAELFFPDINKSVKSKVTYSSKNINQLTRTFNVEMQLSGEDIYRPNMVTVVRIIDYKKDNSVVVPVNTIQYIDGHNHIFVAVKEGTKMVARKRNVTVGLIYNGSAEILEGLKTGDLMITTGYQDLNDGELVKF